jgi:hypothetical protein
MDSIKSGHGGRTEQQRARPSVVGQVDPDRTGASSSSSDLLEVSRALSSPIDPVNVFQERNDLDPHLNREAPQHIRVTVHQTEASDSKKYCDGVRIAAHNASLPPTIKRKLGLSS